jgi:hypothetical protein
VLFACIVTCLLALTILAVAMAGNDTIEFTLWLVSFWVMALGAIAFRSSDDLLDPYSSLIVLYGLYAWSAAAFAVTASPPMYSAEVMRAYYFCVHLGLICFWTGHRITSRRFHAVLAPTESSETFDHRFGIVLIATATVSILLIPGFLASLDAGSIQAYTEVVANWTLDFRADPRAGVDLFVASLPAFYATMALLYFACRTTVTWKRLATSIPVVYFIALDVMRGEKMLLLACSLFIVLFVHYRRRPIRAPALIAPVILLYVFAVMIGHARGTSNLVEMVSRSTELLRQDPTLLFPTNAGELTGPPQTLLVVIESIQQGSARHLGLTHYRDEFAVWVPRALLPDRPRPVSEQYVEMFFPDEDRTGIGHGMFVLTPGYWALGYLGLSVEMLFYGIIVAAAYNFFRSRPSSDASVLVYSQCLFVLTFMCIRTGLLGTLRATLMAATPLLPVVGVTFILLLLARRSRLPTLIRVPPSRT